MQVVGDIARLNAKRYPDKKAVIMDNEYLTFRQLNNLSNQLAHGLMSLGMVRGDRVGLLAFNCLEYPVVDYAVAKCGGILVPINFRYKKDELIYVVNNCSPKILFYGPEFSSIVDDAKDEFLSPVHLCVITENLPKLGNSLKQVMDGQPTYEPNIRVDPESPSRIIYTSGTTGFPKGVYLSHSSYLAFYTGMIIEGDFSNSDVIMVAIPLFHNGGLNLIFQPSLMQGGTCVIMSGGFDPDKILDAVGRYGVTLTVWVPTQLAMLVNHPNLNKYNLSTLKKIGYGSSPITPQILEASMDIFKARFYQWYGLTETSVVAVLRPEDHPQHAQFTGREMINADLRIVSEEGLETPVGEVGEIISDQKPLGMIGYYNMEEANKKTIREGWIHTGDLARVEGGGYFTVVDRLSDMIISGAENIYPKEIEDVISKYPGVREVAVFGIPDDIYGESVCAVIAKDEGHQIDPGDIIDFCSSRISSYKKPKRVEFIDELPKNAAGKVVKKVLREPYWIGREKRI